jgi:hypothetical protein
VSVLGWDYGLVLVSVLGWDYGSDAIVEVYQSFKVKIAKLLGNSYPLGPVCFHIYVWVWKHPEVRYAADYRIVLAAVPAAQNRVGARYPFQFSPAGRAADFNASEIQD